MLKKSKDIQNYIDSIGKTEHLHVFVGQSNNSADDSSTTSSIDLWRDMVFSKKISKNDVIGVIPNISWTYGNVYTPWKSNKINTGNFYVWNKENGNVYLCIQNNELNRIDQEGLNASTYIPNHSYGILKYADGYSWLPIYRITGDLLRFVKTEWIPIISFETFEELSFSTDFDFQNNFCNNNVQATGSCALYFKENNQLQISGTSYETYQKGQLYTNFISECSECYTLFNQNNKFVNKFYTTGISVDSTINLQDKIDIIGTLISNNQLPASSPYYALYEIAQNGPDDGAIISAQIDLRGITGEDLIVTIPNPEITITSATGVDASLRFLTYTNINGKYIIQGIDLISGGNNYKDISLSISSSIFNNSNISDLILSLININYDNIDGLNIDPYDVLNCTNIMVDSRIDTNELNLAQIPLPDTINLFGLVSNPLEELPSGEVVISGSELSPYNSALKNGSSVISVYYPDDFGSTSISQSPIAGLASSTTSVPNTTITKTTNTFRVLKDTTSDELFIDLYPVLLYESTISVSGIDYSNIDNLSSITDSNDNEFIVTTVFEKPSFKQYSGKVLQTKKTSKDLKLTSSSGILSRIIRINMIKGL